MNCCEFSKKVSVLVKAFHPRWHASGFEQMSVSSLLRSTEMKIRRTVSETQIEKERMGKNLIFSVSVIAMHNVCVRETQVEMVSE